MSDDSNPRSGLTRRQMITGAAVTGGLATLGGCKYATQLHLIRDTPEAASQQPEWSESRIRRYKELGTTGFEISDISFGTSKLRDPAVARDAIARGVNYFDTSPDYSDTLSEKAVGEGIQGAPRDKLFIASKFCTADGHLANDTPVAEVIAAVEGSLKRLRTDYLDLAHIHAVNSIDRLMAPTLHEAFDRLKEQGKVRFLGVSSHTPDLETVMHHAVDSGRFNVIMVAYNFDHWPQLDVIFPKAKEKGVGVVAMKTLKGAYHTQLADFTPTERESFAQAAFKWVLANPSVDGLVVTMADYPQVNEYLHASGAALTEPDVALLEKYDRLVEGLYCRQGCGDCLSSCPHDVPIDDVLRYRMYAETYGQEREAMRLYSRLDPARRADACASCAAPCAGSCPHGIPIRDRLMGADELLTLG